MAKRHLSRAGRLDLIDNVNVMLEIYKRTVDRYGTPQEISILRARFEAELSDDSAFRNLRECART